MTTYKKWKKQNTDQSTKINLIGCDTIVNLNANLLQQLSQHGIPVEPELGTAQPQLVHYYYNEDNI